MRRERNRRRAIGGAIVGGLRCVGFVGLGVVLLGRGLNVADKVASVVSMVAGLASLAVAVIGLRRARQGRVVRAEGEFGDVTGAVTAVDVGRLQEGTLISRTKTGDVREGGSVTGLRIDDIGGTDDRGR
jgi:hypothetical protein